MIRVATTASLENPYLRDPDVQLMLRVREGQEDAFGELVSRYQNRLVSLFMHLVGDSAVAFFRHHRQAGIRSEDVPVISFSIAED